MSDWLDTIITGIVVAIVIFFATFILLLNMECKKEIWEEIERLFKE